MSRTYHDAVIKGEIDNRQRGRLTGRVWLVGQDHPVRLHLQGDACSDVAGCLVEFFNPEPVPQDLPPLHRLQTGTATRVTASDRQQDDEGRICNGLHLAWESDQDGRIEIRSIHYKLRVFEQDWPLQDLASPLPAALTQPTEFQWEALLRHPHDQPGDTHLREFERWLEATPKEDEDGTAWPGYVVPPAYRDVWAPDHLPDIEPNPETEGIDWIRDELGEVHHPLTLRCQAFAMHVWQYCLSLDLFEAPGDADTRALVDAVEAFSDRVSGALDELAYDERPDYAYVVAKLKRALGKLHLAMNALYRVGRKPRLAHRAEAFAQELFALREELIALMADYRQRNRHDERGAR